MTTKKLLNFHIWIFNLNRTGIFIQCHDKHLVSHATMHHPIQSNINIIVSNSFMLVYTVTLWATFEGKGQYKADACHITRTCNAPNVVHAYDYPPPPPLVHASIGQKWGGGFFAGSLHFCVTTITDQ